MMKMNIEEMHRLAVQYFEGSISPEAELLLFAFVKEADGNKNLFREWENEWMQTAPMSEKTERAWHQFNWRMRLREELQATDSQTPASYKIKSPGSFVRIAAVVALLVSLSIGGFMYLRQDDGYLYAVEAPYGEKSKLTLRDGSVVWVNSGSKLFYAHTDFSSDIRVKLEGEAFFDVAKDSRRKFVVETSAYDIEVHGTRFNVTAYEDDPIVTTTLLEGSIQLNRKDGQTQVKPGQSVIFDKNSGAMEIAEVDASDFGKWIENTIIYENISLGDLVKKLSRSYNVSIRLESDQLAEKRFNISLRNGETVTDVMRAIERILYVKVDSSATNNYVIKE